MKKLYQKILSYWRRNLSTLFVRSYNRLTWKHFQKISDDELIWRAVYRKEQIKENGDLKPGFFIDKDGLSCDLVSYTTKRRALLGINDPPRPKFGGLVIFKVKNLRGIRVASDIIHKPIKEKKKEDISTKKNYAHCKFSSKLTQGKSKALIRKCKFSIKPDIEKVRRN